MSIGVASPATRNGYPSVRRIHPSYARRGLAAALCGVALTLYWLVDFTSGPDEQDLHRPPLPAGNVEVEPPSLLRAGPRDLERMEAKDRRHVPDVRARLRLSLLSGNYQAAVTEYVEAYALSTVEENTAHRDLLIAHASDLINDQKSDRAIELLRNYMIIFYADVDALVMLGRAYRNEGLGRDAVMAFQQAYRNEHRPGVARHILVQQNNEIGKLVQELKEQNDYDAITDLYEQLTQSQPDVSGYFIALAKAHVAQHHLAEAMRSLAYVQHDARVGPQARAMMAELRGRGVQDPGKL